MDRRVCDELELQITFGTGHAGRRDRALLFSHSGRPTNALLGLNKTLKACFASF